MEGAVEADVRQNRLAGVFAEKAQGVAGVLPKIRQVGALPRPPKFIIRRDSAQTRGNRSREEVLRQGESAPRRGGIGDDTEFPFLLPNEHPQKSVPDSDSVRTEAGEVRINRQDQP